LVSQLSNFPNKKVKPVIEGKSLVQVDCTQHQEYSSYIR
jgi:hypothetical protein